MKRKDTGRLKVELAIAGVAGLVCASLFKPEMMSRIDEMLVTFMSIVLAAVMPGIALTAAAARPPVSTPLEANRYGDRLKEQVGFWFGFLWTGALAVAIIVAGRTMQWRLSTPRPTYVPDWVPEGHAWLILAAISSVAFVAIRARNVVTAVQSLIQVGTDVHAEQVAARRREVQAEVRQQIQNLPQDRSRGSASENRPRH